MADKTIVKFDTVDPELLFHDFELFTQVQEAGGICWTEAAGGMWVIGDFDLIQQVSADERFRSGDGVRFPRSGGPKVLALEYDRPKHAEPWKILTDAVGARAAKGLDPSCASMCDDSFALWPPIRTTPTSPPATPTRCAGRAVLRHRRAQ